MRFRAPLGASLRFRVTVWGVGLVDGQMWGYRPFESMKSRRRMKQHLVVGL